MTTTDTPTAVTISRRTGRRIGYFAAILVNLAIYGFINVWPGWDSFDVVTVEAADVVPIVNVSIAVTILANLVYVVYDGYRTKALGETITSVVTLLASLVVLSVFPFDFSGYALPWAFVARIVLLAAVVGSGIAIIVNLVRLVRGPRP
jgi:hypothetical protein